MIYSDKNEEDKTCKQKYGFLPNSLWWIGKKTEALKRFSDNNFASKTYGSDKNKTPLSQFHPDMAKRCITYWSKEGDLYLDPCMGHGTRMTMGIALKRNYYGQDVCREFFEIARKKAIKQNTLGERHIVSNNPSSFEVRYPTSKVNARCVLQDSKKLLMGDNEADLIFTSPPYWDVEFYGKDEGQMGLGKTYQEFMGHLTLMLMECYRVLKPNKFAIFVVNDIRRDKVLLNFHGDLINVCRDIGFAHWDTVIYNLFSLSQLGYGNCDNNKYTAKMHEYILVFKKIPDFEDKNQLHESMVNEVTNIVNSEEKLLICPRCSEEVKIIRRNGKEVFDHCGQFLMSKNIVQGDLSK